ncbi:hypothetical protein BGLA2_1730002 [Burkholderia gladioli]|nr:hypothetical protein BGLA2_1730002 [Burkholderia gladioli]
MFAVVVISPASTTSPVLHSVSAATREYLSCARMASRIASEIWSATLSGWPSETDSDVKKKSFATLFKLLGGYGCIHVASFGCLLKWRRFSGFLGPDEPGRPVRLRPASCQLTRRSPYYIGFLPLSHKSAVVFPPILILNSFLYSPAFRAAAAARGRAC